MAVPIDVPDSPDDAGLPATKGPTRVYERDGMRVVWDATLCTHAAACIRALPQVFNPAARPWVDVDAAAPEEIAAAVRSCPTGALTLGDEVAPAGPSAAVVVELRPNGPMYVRGDVEIVDPRQGTVARGTRFALCRCGLSQNKPFCDNSHRTPTAAR
ncbi:MAG TPA: (4Fe-4S)-binding protein [Acidimicrobiales bacterium]|nr:(4Fe-4S)-binding protein [Acidimicrobiales bacterium]